MPISFSFLIIKQIVLPISSWERSITSKAFLQVLCILQTLFEERTVIISYKISKLEEKQIQDSRFKCCSIEFNKSYDSLWLWNGEWFYQQFLKTTPTIKFFPKLLFLPSQVDCHHLQIPKVHFFIMWKHRLSTRCGTCLIFLIATKMNSKTGWKLSLLLPPSKMLENPKICFLNFLLENWNSHLTCFCCSLKLLKQN